MNATAETRETAQHPPCACGLPDRPAGESMLHRGLRYWIAFCTDCGRYTYRAEHEQGHR